MVLYYVNIASFQNTCTHLFGNLLRLRFATSDWIPFFKHQGIVEAVPKYQVYRRKKFKFFFALIHIPTLVQYIRLPSSLRSLDELSL